MLNLLIQQKVIRNIKNMVYVKNVKTKEKIKMEKPLFNEIKLDLNGHEGNAYYILATISNLLNQMGINYEERSSILEEMMSKDYEHLCRKAMKYITLKNIPFEV